MCNKLTGFIFRRWKDRRVVANYLVFSESAKAAKRAIRTQRKLTVHDILILSSQISVRSNAVYAMGTLPVTPEEREAVRAVTRDNAVTPARGQLDFLDQL